MSQIIQNASESDDNCAKLTSSLPNLESVSIWRYPFKIGRSKTCDIVLESNHLPNNIIKSISKEHLMLTRDAVNEVIYITDLSKNGLFVNNKRIERNTKFPLEDGNEIGLGQCTGQAVFTFRYEQNEHLPDTLSPNVISNPEDVSNQLMPMWGRLLSCIPYLESVDLVEPVFKVGRSSLCDLVTDRKGIQTKHKQLFSKEHFTIIKDEDNQVVYIKDHSKFGTSLNKVLIGKGNKHILQNDDVISIGNQRVEMFLFKRMNFLAASDLPDELKTLYEPTILLGKGAVGEVRLAFEKMTCNMYAIKRILKAKNTTSQKLKLNHPSKIKSEVDILRNLSHPFVIGMKNIVETPDEVCLVLEYMRGGELTSRIVSNVPLMEVNTKVFFYQMILAVKYLHDNGVTHRDLKPENVLLATEDIETVIKVSDFGLSKITDTYCEMHTVCGTLLYIAPEVLDYGVPYNKQIDVWSLGVILFYMLAKRLPFKSPDKKVLFALIKTGCYDMDEAWDDVSRPAKDLVKKMLITNPKQRITIDEILMHPWLSEDVVTQSKVCSLLENMNLSEQEIPCDIEPLFKRPRLDQSVECTV